MAIDKFHVPEISCHHCVNAVQQEVSAIDGVASVQVELSDKSVTVDHSDRVTVQDIVAAINEAGYDEVSQLNT